MVKPTLVLKALHGCEHIYLLTYDTVLLQLTEHVWEKQPSSVDHKPTALKTIRGQGAAHSEGGPPGQPVCSRGPPHASLLPPHLELLEQPLDDPQSPLLLVLSLEPPLQQEP